MVGPVRVADPMELGRRRDGQLNIDSVTAVALVLWMSAYMGMEKSAGWTNRALMAGCLRRNDTRI